ncbi:MULTISPECIES: hypothetical protein [unclassified Rhizobium]|uniref:hypothetical protein n=1 Tax=unclassified Rhizobium TaxID=2613769 RepID=UPI0007155CCC|nr:MULTISPECIES: hypothetical protein [unclassified Rhizobium]KQS97988.1 hypothetical protein ASG50_22620 [Rhizobium sp. Leaf386]KQT00246.1 hypothetical protein ASG42_05210 [Rhizobium sp. Leaf391]KQT97250.1 hypothetical protein ASG68_09940 [Rhizobium sp. Leaf453]
MKRKLLASIFLVLLADTTFAAAKGAREDIMEKIADVVAFARVCPALEMDTVSVTTMAISQKIGKSNRDYDVIDAMANAREGAIRRGNAELACETGRQQYGPGGNALPGLLRER